MKQLTIAIFLALAIPAHAVTLSWQDNSDNENGFKVERYEEPGTAADYVEIGSVAADVTTFADPAVSFTDPANYCYRVIAFNDSGRSAPDERCMSDRPDAPSGVQITETTVTSRTITEETTRVATWLEGQ